MKINEDTHSTTVHVDLEIDDEEQVIFTWRRA